MVWDQPHRKADTGSQAEPGDTTMPLSPMSPPGGGTAYGHGGHDATPGEATAPSTPFDAPPLTPLPPAAPPLPAMPAPPPVMGHNAEPPAPADPLRAVAVALLNLSGIGIGYALIRRWFAMVLCWIATGALLFVALPADPDGISGSTLGGYLAFLALAAAHGAARGMRTRLSWPPRTPLALVLGVALLAVPTSGAVLYDNAQHEAMEQALLDRLDKADKLVQVARTRPFSTAQPAFSKALRTYHDLDAHHADSRAGKLLPNRLMKYYSAVATPYEQKKYCDAVAPLKYLRTVPDRISAQRLGSLAGWPDDRLATSFYECGIGDLGDTSATDTKNGHLAQLLTTFPKSPQAGKVEPALSDTIDSATDDLKGDEPCSANKQLRTLSAQASELPGDKAGITDALSKDADRADKQVQAGTYACGVDQYKDGDFDAALSTMNDFVDTYKNDKNRNHAKKIAIAAEVAQNIPEAGDHLPSDASGGTISVTIKNDSPDEIEILYTGPVTGSLKLAPCDGCTTYTSEVEASMSACEGGESYPQKTIRLPAGTTYFLHKPSSGDSSASVGTDTAQIDPGFIYTECAYVVQGFGSGLPPDLTVPTPGVPADTFPTQEVPSQQARYPHS